MEAVGAELSGGGVTGGGITGGHVGSSGEPPQSGHAVSIGKASRTCLWRVAMHGNLRLSFLMDMDHQPGYFVTASALRRGRELT